MICEEAIDLMGSALEDALPTPVRPAFAAHLEECPPCHSYLVQLGEAVRSLRRIPFESAPSALRAELIRRFREQSRRDH